MHVITLIIYKLLNGKIKKRKLDISLTLLSLSINF